MTEKAVGEKLVNKTEELSSTIGHGFVSGFAGTLIMTAAQMVEMKMTKRDASEVPVKAAGKALGFKPDCLNEEHCPKKENLNHMVHFTYGSIWGEARAFISSFGLKGWQASTIHFGAVWVAALTMLPMLKVAPPVTQWGLKAIVKDALLHAVYAFGVGYVYDAIHQPDKNIKVKQFNLGLPE